MKEVNGIPVYEEEDICALDEYSKQLEKALTPKFQNIEDNLIESTEKILELEKESDDQKYTTELLKLQVEELKIENTQLKNQIPKGTVKGESIYLSDSSDLEAKIIIKGNLRQATRTNNLYNNLTNTSGFMGQSGDIVSNTGWVVTDFIPVISSIKYYIAGNKFYTEGSGVYGGFYNSEKELLSTFSYSDYRNETSNITIPEGASYIRFSLYKYQDNTLSFDFYTDSINPNYPSTVETVGSNVNLIYTTEEKWERKTIISGNEQTSNTRILCDYIPVFSNKKYNVSLISNNIYAFGNIYYFDNNKKYITDEYTLNQNTQFKELTITIPENCYYIKAVIQKTNNDIILPSEITEIKPKLEKGTKATPYSKYGQGSVEIDVVNKNWLKLINNNITTIGINFSSNLNKINVNGTTTENKTIFNVFDNILLKKGSYVFHFNCENTPPANSCQFILCEDDGTRIVTLSAWGQSQSKIINLEKDTMVSASKSYFYTNKNFTFNNTIYELQIELGEIVSEIVEPQSQSKILPIQEEMLEDDYIDDVEYHTWKKYMITGSENWIKATNGIGKIYFYLSISDGVENQNKSILSNYFVGMESLWSVEQINRITLSANGKAINIMLEDIIELEQFKTWLQEKYNSGNPVVVYYKLATPKSLPLTEEQKNVLDEKTYTYKNVTNINTDSIAILDVRYKKDLETLLMR